MGRSFMRLLFPMDVNKMLAELRTERIAIDQAIMVLERLAAGAKRPRGRPPKWFGATVSCPPKHVPHRMLDWPKGGAKNAWYKAQRRADHRDFEGVGERASDSRTLPSTRH